MVDASGSVRKGEIPVVETDRWTVHVFFETLLANPDLSDSKTILAARMLTLDFQSLAPRPDSMDPKSSVSYRRKDGMVSIRWADKVPSVVTGLQTAQYSTIVSIRPYYRFDQTI